MKLDVKSIAQAVGARMTEIVTPLIARIKALEGRAPEKGERGIQGEIGPQGPAGEKGEQGERGSQGEVGDRGERGEPGAAGAQGEKGETGAAGERGPAGEQGPQGKSLTIDDVRDFLDAAQVRWQMDAERMFYKRVEEFIAALPRPKDGVDGLPIDLVEFNSGSRSLEFIQEGKIVRSVPIYTPRYEGVWHEGSYEKGLMVTFGGNLWSAIKATEAKPGTNGDWILCVKKGRDGRDTK